MSIPSYEALYPLALELGKEERSIREAVQRACDRLGLSQEERTKTVPSGRNTVIRSRLAWAITYLVQAGLLVRPRRGYFVVTQEGNKVLQNPPASLDNQFLKTIPSFRYFLERSKSKSNNQSAAGQVAKSTDDRSPEEVIGDAYLEIQTDLREQILERILLNSPTFFEELVVKLMATLGYGTKDTLATVTNRTSDGGIDGIIHQDTFGLDVVYIQAKRYAQDQTVGWPELQAFVGTLAGLSAHKGVFVTTSRFSSGALAYLKTVNTRIITIDGERLVDLMIASGVGVRTRMTFDLHRVDEDFFLEE